MWTDSTLKIVNDSDPYTGPNGTEYPGNWPKASIPGLSAVTTVPAPSGPGIGVTGFTIQILGGVPTQVWTTISVPIDNSAVIAESYQIQLQRKAAALAAAGDTAGALQIYLKLK